MTHGTYGTQATHGETCLTRSYSALGMPARELLFHYARGEMFTWLNQHDGEVGWVRPTHRGVQMLDRVHIGHAVKKAMASSKFSFKYNQKFDQVVAGCADLGRSGKTWITDEARAAYRDLHAHGFAYSCEAYMGDVLAGGVFGVQIGGFVSIDSMFHHVTNAGKVVYGRHLLHLRDRGFSFVDVNYASEHCRRFGAEWVPQWQFEEMMRPVLRAQPTLRDGGACPTLPWHVRARLAAGRAMSAICRRLMPAAQPLPCAPAGAAEESAVAQVA